MEPIEPKTEVNIEEQPIEEQPIEKPAADRSAMLGTMEMKRLVPKISVPIMLSMQQKFTAGIGTGKQNGAMYAMYIISSIPLIFTSIISMKYFSSGDFAAGIKL